MTIDRGADATRVAAQQPGFTALATGTRLDGRYVIDSVIAAGGFGITYLGHHETLGKSFAVKEHFPRQFAFRDGTTSDVRPSDEPTFRWTLDRFVQEGRSLARCRHQGVVGVADVFQANGTAYMVLEYEEGQSLKSWLDGLGRPPTQAEMDGVLAPLLDALAYVHGQGLLHRDLAPDNIIVRRDGTPCLIDFGAARQAVAEVSQVMSAIVKSGFSPPEQYTRAGKAQGAWSDIYALGATLYRALSGKVPPEATERQIEEEYVPLAKALATPEAYRPGFLAAIDGALRLRHAERPQTVAAWREMLFGQEMTPALAAPVQSPPVSPAIASVPTSARWRRPALVGGGAVAVIAMMAMAGYWGGSSDRESRAVDAANLKAATTKAVDTGNKIADARRADAAAEEAKRKSVADAQAQAEREAERQKVIEATRRADAQRQAQAEAARREELQRKAEEIQKAATGATAPSKSGALPPAAAALTEKDKGRYLRLEQSRATALGYAARSQNPKAQAALAEARKFLDVPAIPINAAQLVGNWRCKSYELGGSLGDDGSEFAAKIGTTFSCRISRDGQGNLTLNKLTGSMKKLARLAPTGDADRLLYFGTTIAQDDAQPTYPAGDAYGHEVGSLQQLSPDRLRIELSEPNHSGSARHEVIEFVRAK